MSDQQKADQATVAFRRLLKEAVSEDQARVDALVVLAQRTVMAVTWSGSDREIRTLTNSAGETAMPLFTSREMMEEAARRYGWHSPDGSLANAEMGARQALRQAVARSVHYVVVDIGADYSVEFTRDEIEPLLSVRRESDSIGPFAGAGKISTHLMQAVKRSRSDFPPPVDSKMPSQFPPAASTDARPAPQAGIPTPPPPAHAPAPPSAPASSNSAGPSEHPTAERARIATPKGGFASPVTPPKTITSAETPIARTSESELPGARGQESKVDGKIAKAEQKGGPGAPGKPAAEDGDQVQLRPLPRPLSDELVDLLSEALRRFPEVEWACAVGGKAGTEIFPVVGLRVDPAFAGRVNELLSALREICQAHDSSVKVLHLTDPGQLTSAREAGTVFFPWRKKPRGTR